MLKLCLYRQHAMPYQDMHLRRDLIYKTPRVAHQKFATFALDGRDVQQWMEIDRGINIAHVNGGQQRPEAKHETAAISRNDCVPQVLHYSPVPHVETQRPLMQSTMRSIL